MHQAAVQQQSFPMELELAGCTLSTSAAAATATATAGRAFMHDDCAEDGSRHSGYFSLQQGRSTLCPYAAVDAAAARGGVREDEAAAAAAAEARLFWEVLHAATLQQPRQLPVMKKASPEAQGRQQEDGLLLSRLNSQRQQYAEGGGRGRCDKPQLEAWAGATGDGRAQVHDSMGSPGYNIWLSEVRGV